MNRFIVSVMALAVVATACTESGLIDTPSFYANEISFDPYIGKTPATKAESIDDVYMQKKSSKGSPAFHVYAFLHATGNQASEVDVTNPYLDKDVWYDNDWTYEGTEYWPDSTPLAFVAYGSNAESCITSHPSATKFEFTVNDDIAYQKDLLATPFMMNQLDNGQDTKVNLVFKHLLSRINFSVIATNPSEDVDIAIRSVKLIGDFYTAGIVDLTKNVAYENQSNDMRPYVDFTGYATSTKEYQLFKTDECFEISSASCSTAVDIFPNVKYTATGQSWDEMYTPIDNATEGNHYLMLMPSEDIGDDARIEVQFQLTSDIKRIANVDLSNFEFKPGYAYDFVLKVSTSSISFSANMGGWDDQTYDEYPLQPVE